jgi:hypothetical protein
MSKNLKSNHILLCDSTSKLEDIDQIIDEHDPLIIAFDIESHNLLLKKNIVHKLSDDYLSDKDLNDIQDLTYHFSNWYAESKISNLIEYEGINIGELFYIELSYFLTPKLKIFFEIQQIYKEFKNPSFFSSSSLIDILKLFSSNFYILKDNDEKKSSISNNDLSIKFGKFTLKTNSQNTITKNIIKSLYSIFNNFLSPKKIDYDKPTILLLNFTTLRFEKFFEELPNHSINLIKYDTIAPAFWNYRTLSLIKKSQCHIENNETILQNDDSLTLENINSLINEKLNILLENEEFFKRFFSLNTLVFWNVIKNDFIEMFTTNYNNAIQNIAKIKFLFKKYSISYIMLTSECSPLDLITIHLSKQLGIKTGILQHALYYDDLKNHNYHNFKCDEFHRVRPIYSDNFLVWGKLTQIDSQKHGLSSEKIVSLGCPYFDAFLNNIDNSKKLEEKYILLATTPKTHTNFITELNVKNQIEYYDNIKQISEITTKINKNLLIKVHHYNLASSNEKELVNKINPKIIVETTGSFYKYAQKCEVLICIDSSTAILEAMLLKKPVILVLINDKDDYPELFQNNYVIITPISELENILIKLSNDSSYKKQVIKNQESFLNYYLDNIGTSSNALLNFLDKMNDQNK